ncbi:MAG: D-glycero-beta-D-manno-heptose-7-phosphate kinase [Micavibrio sp.]|nr:D-glycero-beta-D-manno-heptose-7-phosphate kinase [Micavibrio sp.]
MLTEDTDMINTLNALTERLSDARILVIGDIMLDSFVYGKVDRISPESPVPILTVKREESMLGGSGNALSNLAGLNIKANILAMVGSDNEATQIKDKIKAIKCEPHLIEDTARPTILKIRYLAGHQQLLRSDYEHSAPISDALANEIIKSAKDIIPNVGALIISDYGKGMLSDDVLSEIISAAKDKGVPVIVDPKGRSFKKYEGASIVTPNKKELSDATTGEPLDSDEEVVEAANMIINECGIETVIATRSGEGMSVISKGKDPVHIKGADIEVFDVSGAGDTVIATIGASLAAGADAVEAANLANIAGSIVVTKVGTAPIRFDELKDALHSDLAEHLNNAGKERIKADRAREADLLNWQEAAEQVRRWKARGLKVGFTNGCFDILHFGHVTYLNNAAAHCDRLIMGLNKDSSIQILKGPERPVHNEQSRAAVIGALGSIDMVVLFGGEEKGDNNTACPLLDMIKPDIYFKGGDYTVDQIPEAPTIIKNGGEVKVMPVYEGHSTTSSIKKIKQDQAA